MALRVNPRLGTFARQMRSEPFPIESRLWRRPRSSQLGGFTFRRQMVIEPYICDFYCSAIGLVVEVDGDDYEVIADQKRDAAIADKGFRILRFTNGEVASSIEGVLEAILGMARAMPARFTHPPTPSLEREGES